MLANADGAYKADAMCLADMEKIYGTDNMIQWIRAQVLALYGSSSCSDKGVADGIPLFCASFAQQVRGFKVTELMLFFARYKAGRYDNSFYAFDARRIGNAFFKEFLKERNQELDRINSEIEREKIEKRKFTPPEGYTSLSWYIELKRRAEMGDEEAQNALYGRED